MISTNKIAIAFSHSPVVRAGEEKKYFNHGHGSRGNTFHTTVGDCKLSVDREMLKEYFPLDLLDETDLEGCLDIVCQNNCACHYSNSS